MTEQSKQPQNPPAGNERPEVYSVSQDKDGSFHFSRRNLFTLGAAIGGALLLRGVCPRFAAKSAPGESLQAGILPLPGVPIHTAPSIASNIADTLQQNDLVRLISERADLGWVEVATQSGQQGWVERSSVDFSRAIESSSPNFDLSSDPSPPPAETAPHLTFSAELNPVGDEPNEPAAVREILACGEIILNGNFESGSAYWTEDGSGAIIRSDYPYPVYQGSYVAWFGGNSADERLTQQIHLPADVRDAQTLTFYLRVDTADLRPVVYDALRLRFLNGVGTPISDDLPIANNTTPTSWVQVTFNLDGLSGFADQNIRIQFECETDLYNVTYFALDVVSMVLLCGPLPVYLYLPLVMKSPPPTPTPNPCPSDCPSDCPSYCSSDCTSDCSSDYCSSDCVFDCIYDCTFDCIYYCGYDW